MPAVNPSLGNLEDARQLRQILSNLQKRLSKLEAAALPLATHQHGVLPGTMRAVTVGDVGLKSAMWLNLNGQLPGLAPYQAVTDPSGTIRVELGNLAANGVSAAHYGWRVSDATGTPIADAIGLSQVMKQLGRGDIPGGPAPSFNTTTPTVVSGCSITFSLIRTARVLTFLMAVASVATNNGPVGETDLYVDGTNIPNATLADNADSTLWTTVGNSQSLMTIYSASLAAGSHTIEPRAYVRSTPQTMTLSGMTIFVYLLGT